MRGNYQHQQYMHITRVPIETNHESRRNEHNRTTNTRDQQHLHDSRALPPFLSQSHLQPIAHSFNILCPLQTLQPYTEYSTHHSNLTNTNLHRNNTVPADSLPIRTASLRIHNIPFYQSYTLLWLHTHEIQHQHDNLNKTHSNSIETMTNPLDTSYLLLFNTATASSPKPTHYQTHRFYSHRFNANGFLLSNPLSQRHATLPFQLPLLNGFFPEYFYPLAMKRRPSSILFAPNTPFPSLSFCLLHSPMIHTKRHANPIYTEYKAFSSRSNDSLSFEMPCEEQQHSVQQTLFPWHTPFNRLPSTS